MSVILALAAINENVQAVMLKNLVLNSGWFDSDQTKFEN